jgi:hypothetical protein
MLIYYSVSINTLQLIASFAMFTKPVPQQRQQQANWIDCIMKDVSLFVLLKQNRKNDIIDNT